jgi:type IV fimbrial biogenesis protein FimT
VLIGDDDVKHFAHSRLHSRKVEGFTIVEMLVVIAMVGLLMMAVLPSAGDLLSSVRMRSAAESVTSGLQRARMDALRKNAPVTFWLVDSPTGALDSNCALSSSSASWVVSLDEPSGRCSEVASESVTPRILSSFYAGASANNLTISSYASDGNASSSIAFNGFGLPLPANISTAISTIDFTSSVSGSRRLRIQIGAGGDIRMCDRDVAATDPRHCI